MSCKCNDCQDPFVLPVGPQGPKGEPGKDGISGGNGGQGTPGSKGNPGGTGAQGDDGRGYDATSSTSLDTLTVVAATASAIITVEKAYTVGARVRFSDTANPAVNYFEGIVTAYNTTSGAMSVGSIDLYRGTGTITSWDVNLVGERGSDVYDSGWKTINTYTGGQGFGLASIGWANPQVRVIGRTLYIDGVFMMPLANAGGGTLRTPYTDYTITRKTEVDTYTGIDGGFTLDVGNGSLTSRSPILPLELRPVIDHQMSRLEFSQRSVEDQAGSGSSITLATILQSIYINSTGDLFMTSHKDIHDAAGAAIGSSPLHTIITKADAGEFVLDFSAYKTSFAGAVDQRIVTASLYKYPATIDGEDVSNLGGFFFPFTTSYPISTSYTELQIKAAFDSI